MRLRDTHIPLVGQEALPHGTYYRLTMQTEQLSLFDNSDLGLPCPLQGRRVAVTGQFAMGRQALRGMLLRLGATDVKFDKLQRNTHFLLVGEAPDTDVINYWRLYVHDGYNIRRLSPDDLERIKAGDYAPYQVEEEVKKCVHLTREHLYWNAPAISGLRNVRRPSPLSLQDLDVLYGLEIYAHPLLLGQYPELGQLVGCLGGYVNAEMADDTDCILMPEAMPREMCLAVEEYYNASRSQRFDTPFIVLEDLVAFLHRRLERIPDAVMADLMGRLPF